MNSIIRKAMAEDVPAIEHIVHLAYKGYTPRLGKPPGPMTNDYHAKVRSGKVWVLLLGGEIVGIIVLVPKPEYMLLENVAVLPERQRLGLGHRLLTFAEEKARECGYKEVQLYTNELMHENLAWYTRIGYEETARRNDSGFKRVFMKKRL